MNKDCKRRDEIIWGDYTPKRYTYGGCVRFNMDAETLKQLVKEDFIDMKEAQNDSPSTEDFLNSIDGLEDYVTFEAYAISPDRDDYRITIEGIDIDLPREKLDDYVRFIQEFRYADEFNPYSDDSRLQLRAWWD